MRIFCGCLNSCWKCIACGYRQPSKVLLEKINLEIAHRGITISDLEAKMEGKPIADIGAAIMSFPSSRSSSFILRSSEVSLLEKDYGTFPISVFLQDLRGVWGHGDCESIPGFDPDRKKTLWAVDDCSIAVETGEVVGLLGANGAGKTTIFQMIAGLLSPTTG